jgi:ribosomal RNA-processing protein 9
VRLWRVSEDRKRLEAVGAVGGNDEDGEPLIRGIVNDVALFERGDKAKDGLSIAVAVGKEHRFGRWKKAKGKNGLVVLEVARKGAVNGTAAEDHE